MDKVQKNEKPLRNYQVAFDPIKRYLIVKSLRKDYKSIVKQSVIQNLPVIITEFTKELLKQNSTKSEKSDEN